MTSINDIYNSTTLTSKQRAALAPQVIASIAAQNVAAMASSNRGGGGRPVVIQQRPADPMQPFRDVYTAGAKTITIPKNWKGEQYEPTGPDDPNVGGILEEDALRMHKKNQVFQSQIAGKDNSGTDLIKAEADVFKAIMEGGDVKAEDAMNMARNFVRPQAQAAGGSGVDSESLVKGLPGGVPAGPGGATDANAGKTKIVEDSSPGGLANAGVSNILSTAALGPASIGMPFAPEPVKQVFNDTAGALVEGGKNLFTWQGADNLKGPTNPETDSPMAAVPAHETPSTGLFTRPEMSPGQNALGAMPEMPTGQTGPALASDVGNRALNAFNSFFAQADEKKRMPQKMTDLKDYWRQ